MSCDIGDFFVYKEQICLVEVIAKLRSKYRKDYGK